MQYWLFKSEPDTFSYADLENCAKATEPWTGVRNYQARNFMRDDMKLGDLGLFYHSSCPKPGVAGVLRITKTSYPDPTQFDPQSAYFDPKSTPQSPRWFLVNVTAVAPMPHFVPLSSLRKQPNLDGLLLLNRGSRLSITPVKRQHFLHICQLGNLQTIPA